MRACAVSYGAPTLFHVSRAERSAVAAPSQSCSASRIRPSASWTVPSKTGVRRPSTR